MSSRHFPSNAQISKNLIQRFIDYRVLLWVNQIIAARCGGVGLARDDYRCSGADVDTLESVRFYSALAAQVCMAEFQIPAVQATRIQFSIVFLDDFGARPPF